MIPVVTEISPIFGLTLVGMVEIAVFVGAAVGIGSSLIIAWVIHRRNKELLEQQKIINSAKLTWHFLEFWRDIKHDKLMDFLDRLHRSEIKKDDPLIGVAVTLYESIAIFCREGTLIENHVKEFFGNSLVDMRDNEVIQDYIKDGVKDEDDALMNLQDLFRKSRKWKFR